MATLTIRNVDESLKEALRVKAARSGRSMEEELRQILRRAVLEERAVRGLGTRISERFAVIGGVDLGATSRSLPRPLPVTAEDSGDVRPLPRSRQRTPRRRG